MSAFRRIWECLSSILCCAPFTSARKKGRRPAGQILTRSDSGSWDSICSRTFCISLESSTRVLIGADSSFLCVEAYSRGQSATVVVVPSLQGRSDPLMPGQRRANLKYWSPVEISELVLGARYVDKVTGWFTIGSCGVTCCEEEAMVGPSVIGLVGATTATSAIAVSSLRTSAWTMVVSCCSGISVVLVSTSWTAVPCCNGLPVLRMSSVASWRKDYNQPEYMCIYKIKKFKKFQRD